MGKPTEEKIREKDGDTKILFKKSINTLFTHSRTGSGASQLATRSGILQLKENFKKHNDYYLDRGKLKRDLSVETDICILRRYYKSKRNKMSNQGSSAKSRYSTVVDTEVETIEEFPDTSACGDNEIVEVRSNRPIDIEALMVDNLKELLNEWIRKHLLYNKDTQQKLDTVLDSILHKLDGKNEEDTSSDSTYVLQKKAQHQEVKNKKVATASITCQYCKRKSRRDKHDSIASISQNDPSSLTIPCNYKDLRIISTLSIPLSFHKRGLDQNKNKNSSSYKLRRIKRKNLILSINRSNKLLDSSSFDLLTISTKSLTKRCANYDVNVKKKRHIVFFPKPFYKSATDSTSTTKPESTKVTNFEVNKDHLEEMPSLLRSLYANDPGIITTSMDKNVQFDTKNDNYTMTEEIITHNISHVTVKRNISLENNLKYINQTNQYDSNIARDYINEEIKFATCNKDSFTNMEQNKIKLTENIKKITGKDKINKRKKNATKRIKSYPKFSNRNKKRFTFLFEKANKQINKSEEFLKYCQNIFQYFTESDSNRSIKVDVRINLFPISDHGTKNVYTHISNQALNTYELKNGPTLLYNVQPTIIPEEQSYVQPIVVESQRTQVTVLDNVESEKDATISSSQCSPEIIPLLDGAVSQAKYIFDVNSKEKTETKSNMIVDRGTVTSELEILQEISELRAVIKDLATTAERFVSEQMKKESNKFNSRPFTSQNLSENYTSSSRCQAVINLRNPSKATQVSAAFEKNPPISGIKLSKKESKKKDTFEYYNRLTKKSTSYRIIDSESLLKVTDMTSKANEVNDYSRQYADEALTCSLPKSRSLFEMTTDRDKKLIAFFCDNYVKPPKVAHNICNNSCTTPIRCKSSKTTTKSKIRHFWSKKEDKAKCKISCSCHSVCRSSRFQLPPETDCGYSSTLSGHSINSIEEQQNEEIRKICKGRGMGFGEGCVYCLLMWIPVLIILGLLYSFVLKDWLNSKDKDRVIGRKLISKPLPIENSTLYLKLSDLGF